MKCPCCSAELHIELSLEKNTTPSSEPSLISPRGVTVFLPPEPKQKLHTVKVVSGTIKESTTEPDTFIITAGKRVSVNSIRDYATGLLEFPALEHIGEDLLALLNKGDTQRPKIICLCGSTRFKQAFLQAQKEFTLKGFITLSVGLFGHADAIVFTDEEKHKLDELHLHKIDLADEVCVININGYIGESTKREIEYAQQHNKPVFYYDPTVPPPSPAEVSCPVERFPVDPSSLNCIPDCLYHNSGVYCDKCRACVKGVFGGQELNYVLANPPCAKSPEAIHAGCEGCKHVGLKFSDEPCFGCIHPLDNMRTRWTRD